MEILGTELSYAHLHKDGVDWVFVDHASFQREGGLYGDSHGVYGDNQVHFAGLPRHTSSCRSGVPGCGPVAHLFDYEMVCLSDPSHNERFSGCSVCWVVQMAASRMLLSSHTILICREQLCIMKQCTWLRCEPTVGLQC